MQQLSLSDRVRHCIAPHWHVIETFWVIHKYRIEQILYCIERHYRFSRIELLHSYAANGCFEKKPRTKYWFIQSPAALPDRCSPTHQRHTRWTRTLVAWRDLNHDGLHSAAQERLICAARILAEGFSQTEERTCFERMYHVSVISTLLYAHANKHNRTVDCYVYARHALSWICTHRRHPICDMPARTMTHLCGDAYIINYDLQFDDS